MKNQICKLILLCVLIAGAGFTAVAKVTLPRLVSNGMVLQRNQPLNIWGWAKPKEVVGINFLGKSYRTVTGNLGKWEIKLDPAPAGGPYEMTVSGENTILIRDILMGDVWLCSGQSNMTFELRIVAQKYASDIALSGNSRIRQFFVPHNYGFNVAKDVNSDGWVTASPKTVLNFTAVGYFFAKELFDKYQVPIGLINSACGGTPAEAWTSEAGLKDFPNYLQIANNYKDSSRLVAKISHDKALVDDWYKNIKSTDKGLESVENSWVGLNINDAEWATAEIPGYWGSKWLKGQTAGVVYFRKEINISNELAGKEATLYLGKIKQQDSTYLNGIKIGSNNNSYTPRIYKIPGNLIKSGKNVITVRILSNGTGGFDPYNPNPYQLVINNKPIPLTGAWKYKVGASVSFSSDSLTTFNQQPTVLFNTMIAPLIPYSIKGVIWYQGENNVGKAQEYQSLFPSLIKDWREQWHQKHLPFLFVQLANFQTPSSLPVESSWAELREAQTQTLSLKETGMAVIHDIGEGMDIHPLNKKDVGLRLALIAEHQVYNDKKVSYTAPVYRSVRFSEHKATLYFTHAESGLVSKDGQPLRYFAIAGADKKFVWAKSTIEGDHIIVWNESVPDPVAVRYAWADNPEGVNLYNSTGLPVSSFRTDNWKRSSKTN